MRPHFQYRLAPMNAQRLHLPLLFVLALTACDGTRAQQADPDPGSTTAPPKPGTPLAALEGERHLKNLRQLTFGGENAEAYFSFDEQRLIFQTTRPPHGCDQMYVMDRDGANQALVSSGLGRTTCGYFLPDGRSILYASTHLASPDCPPPPDRSQGYVWAIYESYDIFTKNLKTGEMTRLTDAPGYDAEATVSPRGDRIVFTSVRDGDLDLYSMRLDGSDVKRLTSEVGYDGGAFFSADGSKIVYRAMRPATPEAEKDYKALLERALVRPTALEIFVMDADGSNKRQVTDLGAASFAPFMHPDGKRIIFSSNYGDEKRRNFDLYMINVDGSGLERVTTFDSFDGFPMFTMDGKTLVFCSNRHNAAPHDTNVFMADWAE